MPVPNPGGLLQAIQGLVKLINTLRSVVKTSRLVDIDISVDIAIKKGSFNVYLFDFEVVSRRNSEQYLIAYRLYYYSERFIEIDTFTLLEAAYYLPGFIPNNRIVSSFFKLIDLFTIQNINPFRGNHEGLYPVFEQGVDFVLHTQLPFYFIVDVGHSFLVAAGFIVVYGITK